jgi:hypothetical protein
MPERRELSRDRLADHSGSKHADLHGPSSAETMPGRFALGKFILEV